MGNYINPPLGYSTFLLNSVQSSCESLTKWKKNSILNFHRVYLTLFPISLYLTYSEFTKLVLQVGANVQIDLVFNKFKLGSFNTVNMLEVLAVVITYSSVDLENKVKIAFKIFDFDHSMKISMDEFSIMSKSFVKGIKIACGYINETETEDKTMQNLAIDCETDADGQISLQSLENWVKSNKILIKLFKRKSFELNQGKKNFNLKKFPETNKRRKSSHSETNYLPYFLFLTPTQKDFSDLFYSCCNRNRRAQASKLYNEMMKKKKFQKHANDFFCLFHLKLNAELTHQDFLNCFKNYTENPFESSYKFVQSRRKGFAMEKPQGVIKEVIEKKESREKNRKRVLLKLFNQYDENKDGSVDLNELKSAMGRYVTTRGIEDLFEEFDQDRNKTLDFEEFMNMFSAKTYDIKHKKSLSADFDN